MMEYLSLGIFAFLWAIFALVCRLEGREDPGRVRLRDKDGQEAISEFRVRRGLVFVFRVATPLVAGIVFFSYGVSLWNPETLESEPIVNQGKFVRHSLSYLDSLQKVKIDSSPLAWHEISGLLTAEEKPDAFSASGPIVSPLRNPTPIRVMRTFWSLS